MQRRLERFDAKLAQSGLDALLVTGQNNIYYLTDFWGTNATVFITKNRRLFLTDSRYTLIAKQSVHGFDIIESKDPLKDIVKFVEADNLEIIGFDNQVSFAYYQGLQAIFEGYTLSPQSNFMEELRMIKDEKELATIRKACSISDRAFTDVLDFIKPGQTTELQVANFLDFRMREYGASGISFESIIASGYRSAMPHGVASDKVIQSGETLTMDFGCYYNHYVSDMTRTIHIGETTDEEREIYDIVLRSNQALIDAAKAGMTRRDYDKVARDVIVEAGYGDHFTHGIGHGIGLDIHEIPYFGNSDETIEAGMVLTDEPGIYLADKYGVRIEDDIIITENGCELITLAPKELIVL
ncbi:Xaa-Pro peptidase family protein [Streptococcus vestibularis]|uniref:M24 family metallopeptidase n=1 Tax=Streptococcus vestibularis TaxID=1343 RepID=UPI00232E031B|nr:Xaa-Pro peptidase family protein [Streptococcus vestibularis]MDB6185062.1 Xaa-Pro peptidase family protein [Streptococcus vestibularis]MDB6201820.1 Xaa-Pro peptidase family protein [Streptococcus vestibularis]MDB6208556.1 Xaa-Pro peptidase family protein [Streptococcus vestibularis]MDB6212224.1 Xaa-Pro peptidase family protein [Streptococcus vestibularis]MDB6215261.1 Xaa-Pro peptidase family protein [Streptococcus vestibularis]